MSFTVYDFYIVLAGLMAGFLNVVAAGGSLLTLPLLIFLGVPAPIANATNRVSILFQNIIGVAVFVRKRSIDYGIAKTLILPALLGAVVGTYLAVFLDDYWMRRVIGVIMLLMGVIMCFDPKRWLEGSSKPVTSKLTLKKFIVFFVIGAYGGFIHAGIGVFLLAGLVLVSGLNLAQSNPIKIFLALFYTLISVIIFSYQDLIWWKTGLTLACGSMLGAWIGAHVSLKWGSNFIRWCLILVVIVSSTKLLGLW